MPKLISTALAVFLVATPAFADHYADDAATNTRDNLLWRQAQSFKGNGSGNKKCKVSQAAGKIVFDATGGKGGGAAYLSAWRTDWTDSFSVEFSCDLSVPVAPTKSSQSAVAGVNFGFEDEWNYDETEGVRNGVQVQIVQSVAGRTLQIISNKNGKDYDESAAVALTPGEHRFEVSWMAAPDNESVTVLVFVDGSDDPILTMEDAQWAFHSRTWDGVVTSLFAYSCGRQKFTARMDNFEYWGDDFTSESDEDWNDVDDHSDDTGGRGQGRGADDAGGSGTAPHASLANCILALNAALAAYPGHAAINSKADAQAGWLDVALQETGTTARDIRVNLVSHAIEQVSIRDAEFDELSSFGVLPAAIMTAETAMSSAVATSAGSQVYEIQMKEADNRPVWRVMLVRTDGGVIEREYVAD